MPTITIPPSLRRLEVRIRADIDEAHRGKKLMADLSGLVRLEPAQRSAVLVDLQAAKAAFEAFGSAQAQADAERLQAMLSTGLASITTREGHVLLPIGALDRPDVVPLLPAAVWAGLGFGSRTDLDELGVRLQHDFPHASGLFSAARVKALSGHASDSRRAEKPRRRDDGTDGDPPANGNHGTLPGGSGVAEDVLAKILDLAKDLGEALLRAQWSADVFYIHISLDRAGADAIEKVLVGNAGTYLAQVGKQVVDHILPAILAGTLAKASVPWVGLALLHFSAYWGGLIALNKGPNGAVLHHLMPWWVPLTAGIYSGYVSPK